MLTFYTINKQHSKYFFPKIDNVKLIIAEFGTSHNF